MALIELLDVSKKFGDKVILQGANLSIAKNERIGLIGRNGDGKSTLMKIICGALAPDSGRVIREGGEGALAVEMLAQSPSFEPTLDVRTTLQRELRHISDAIADYEATLERLSAAPDDPALIHAQNELLKFIDAKDGWNLANKTERILDSFGLRELENKPIGTLSGGEVRRVALGALILKKPDVLLLDEPTNHLDVYMVRFLEEFLLSAGQTIVFISHDRYFIDRLATRTVELDGGALRSFEGGYANYLTQKERLLASMAKSHETLVKWLRSEEEWLRRGVRARVKRNEGRKARIMAMREEAKKNPSVIRKVRLELERATKSFQTGGTNINRRKMLFECKDLGVVLGGKRLFGGFNARVLQGERIGIVGKNGSGKSTLLRVFLGELVPSEGAIKTGGVRIGYFDQSRRTIDERKSIIELFCPNGGDHILVRGRNYHVYGYLKNFLFPKEFLTQPISTLSGGEKNRLALALLFTREYDCLVLDEPTNDLDIATINILEEYLMSFEGAILIVSHDRYFVDKITNKLWAFERGRIEQIYTQYSEYLDYEDELGEVAALQREYEGAGGGVGGGAGGANSGVNLNNVRQNGANSNLNLDLGADLASNSNSGVNLGGDFGANLNANSNLNGNFATNPAHATAQNQAQIPAQTPAPNFAPTTPQKPKTTPKLSYKQKQILERHPDLIDACERRIAELGAALSDPEIYRQVGIQALYEELEEKRAKLEELEAEYFFVLEISEKG